MASKDFIFVSYSAGRYFMQFTNIIQKGLSYLLGSMFQRNEVTIFDQPIHYHKNGVKTIWLW